MREVKDIDQFLEEHNLFGEAIIEHMEWRHYATEISILINIITEKDGTVRRDLQEPRHIILTFRLVHGFRLVSDFSPAMIEDITHINWGINEISSMRHVPLDDQLGFEKNSYAPCHCIEIRWENDRRMVIEFGSLLVSRGSPAGGVPRSWTRSTLPN